MLLSSEQSAISADVCVDQHVGYRRKVCGDVRSFGGVLCLILRLPKLAESTTQYLTNFLHESKRLWVINPDFPTAQTGPD